MTSIRLFVTLSLMLLALGLRAQVISTGPKVNVEYDRGKDFSEYRAYEWMSSQKPADNMANHIRFTRAIQKEMEDVGYRVDTKRPDVRVLYTVATSSKVQAAASQTRSAYYDPTDVVTDFVFASGSKQQYGTLTVELFDARTNALAWRASTTQQLGTPDKAQRIIDHAVKTVFTKYPTRGQN
jgi:hypothetical protein